MKLRVLVLPLAAVVIAGLVWYKSMQPVSVMTPEQRRAILERRPAPVFKLHDVESQMFRLDRYLGRHKLVVAFFNPRDGVADNPQLQILRDGYEQLTAHGEKVLALSVATPYAHRKAMEGHSPFPFHLLSDADFSAHTAWECMESGDPPEALPGIFVVDRAGVIVWSKRGRQGPVSLAKLLEELQRAR